MPSSCCQHTPTCCACHLREPVWGRCSGCVVTEKHWCSQRVLWARRRWHGSIATIAWGIPEVTLPCKGMNSVLSETCERAIGFFSYVKDNLAFRRNLIYSLPVMYHSWSFSHMQEYKSKSSVPASLCSCVWCLSHARWFVLHLFYHDKNAEMLMRKSATWWHCKNVDIVWIWPDRELLSTVVSTGQQPCLASSIS